MTQYGVKQIWHTSLTAENSLTDREGVGVLRMEGGNIYQYVRADGSGVTVDELLQISESYIATTLAVTVYQRPKILAVAMCTLTISYYGWVLRSGVTNVRVLKTMPKTKGQGSLYLAGLSAGVLGTGGTTATETAEGIYVLTGATTAEDDVSCMVAFL